MMSRQELDYLYDKVYLCLESRIKVTSPLRKAFMNHMKLVIKALDNIEWVNARYMKKGDENESILDVLEDEDSLEKYKENKVEKLKV